MAVRETGTEQLIKDTAKRIFLSEGKLHATTQDIADEAGVNRSLVHYYFRSRDLLFDQVMDEAKADLRNLLDSVLQSELGFRDKIRNLIGVFIDETMKYPFRELFIITETNTKPDLYKDSKEHSQLKLFMAEIKGEMDKGIIKAMDPRHWLMNLFSMMAYPILSGSLNKSFMKISDTEFNKLMKQRKNIVFEMVFP